MMLYGITLDFFLSWLIQAECVKDQDPPMGHKQCQVLYDNDRGNLLPQKHTTRISIQDPETEKRRFCPRPGIKGKYGWCEIYPPAAVSYN